MAPDAHPSTAPIPAVGKLFIASALLGVGLVVAGIAGRNPVMIYIGAGVLGVVLLAGLVGHHVS